jgi:hypothetical protein
MYENAFEYVTTGCYTESVFPRQRGGYTMRPALIVQGSFLFTQSFNQALHLGVSHLPIRSDGFELEIVGPSGDIRGLRQGERFFSCASGHQGISGGQVK